MTRVIICWLGVGLFAGWAAGKIMKGTGYGVIRDILLGMVGSIVGGALVWLSRPMLNVPSGTNGGPIFSILVAILGAVTVIWIARHIKRPS